MKKNILIIILLLLILSISGCKKEKENNIEDLKIISPTGAPSVAFYNYSDNDNYQTNSVPKNIISFMTDNSNYDIVVIDTVSGIKAINNGANYKIAATITFGNFYIASTGNDENGKIDETDKIVLFGKNQTPDLIFHYLYGNIYDENIEYVSAVSDAATCLASGKNMETGSDVDYVFIAEPALFACLNNKEAKTYGKSSVYQDIQALYKEKNNGLSLIQASIFVKSNLDSKVVDEFLNNLENDINIALENPNKVEEGFNKISEELASLKYGVKINPIKACLNDNNSLGLGYKKAINIKTSIDSFISLFDLGETNEEIYFK